jgi:transposase
MGHYDLTDEHFASIEPELPINDGKIGHPWNPHRPIINGIFWRLHTGAAWPDIPERYGNMKAIPLLEEHLLNRAAERAWHCVGIAKAHKQLRQCIA